MAQPAKKERNKLIVKLIDVNKWTYDAVKKEVGLKAKSTVYEIYHREKARVRE